MRTAANYVNLAYLTFHKLRSSQHISSCDEAVAYAIRDNTYDCLHDRLPVNTWDLLHTHFYNHTDAWSCTDDNEILTSICRDVRRCLELEIRHRNKRKGLMLSSKVLEFRWRQLTSNVNGLLLVKSSFQRHLMSISALAALTFSLQI